MTKSIFVLPTDCSDIPPWPQAELEEFLKFNFFPRVGGGIGMTRMISALDKQNTVT